MTAAQLRARLTRRFVDEIDELKYPSTSMLERVESRLDDPETLASYIESLVRKVEDTRFPSVSMLQRIDGLIARLERAERARGS